MSRLRPLRERPPAVGLLNGSRGRVDQLAGTDPFHGDLPLGSGAPIEMQGERGPPRSSERAGAGRGRKRLQGDRPRPGAT